MRNLAAASLLFLAGCLSQPQATIQATVEERVRIDGLSGERVQLCNNGPGELVFELQREKGPAQKVKIAEGLSWSFALDGLRSIVVAHKGEGAGHLTLMVSGRAGGGIRVVPLAAQ